jgi:hypothetical protein
MSSLQESKTQGSKNLSFKPRSLKGHSIREKKQSTAFSAVLIKLLQGFVVSDDKKYWESLLTHQEAIREYYAVLGLQLHLSTDDGYAFLKPGAVVSDQEEAEFTEEGEALDDAHAAESQAYVDEKSLSEGLPSLVRKSPLSFEVSLLCILLREALEQFDSKVSDDYRLVLHRTDIYDLLKLFYGEKTDETKQMKRFDVLINRVIDLGFLKELRGNQNSFEVRRVIKALFDAEKLSEIKMQMQSELENSGLDSKKIERDGQS